ncbi:putative flap endonuclease-1-like 5' DNA nuclease [Rubricella aquisinus]|uniref:Putative flap endonuclease-1-like 5' DNA nuclease n=1 Tax=Rubricella aquisinus TaxID=2028108 RepID=A0A840WKY1_9RHOB|nr:NADH:ubiquinone oxidoreductase [Rubricella aquisinus]MBB5515719.1 putative flap endonuclease-1-like 5' DNA nuclease [Rubricella aquisinus]
MTTQNETGLSGTLFSLIVAAGVACLVFGIITLLGDVSLLGRLFIAAIVASALAIVLIWSFGKPLPAPNAAEAVEVQPVSVAPVTAPAAPTATETADWRQNAAAPVEAAKPAAKPAPEKKAAAPATAAEPAAAEGDGPARLTAARDGGPDDLKKIKGVGPKLEGVLHGMGFYHFDQIASWSADDVAWADQNLVGFKGRVSRDDWVGQAKALAAGEETEFSKKVDKGGVY